MRTRLFTIFLLFFVIVSLNAFGGRDSGSRGNQVVVYTYGSFISEWGPGPQLERLFEEKTRLDLVLVDAGDGGQILGRAVLEKDAPQADVLLGLDNNQLNAARNSGALRAYKPEGADAIPAELVLAEDWLLTPFDWSCFAMIYDTQSSVPAPASLSDLASEAYRGKIILMDPRTSTPGLGFVAWTVAVFGDGYLDFWRALKPNILTMTPSWSTGYGLFTSGEAPLVVSYTTSPAYHAEYGEGDRFRALIFDHGHSFQVEGAAVVRNAPNGDGAERFMDFLVSDEAQNLIPLTQWMYPVSGSAELPASYSAAPVAQKMLSVDNDTLSGAVAAVMRVLAE